MKPAQYFLLFGSALMALAAYDRAASANEPDRAPSALGEPAVVVTAERGRDADARIRGEVLKQIREQPSLRSFNIAVYASDRKVYLQGLVDTPLDRDLGEAIARSVAGVGAVDNGLVVSGL